MRIVQSLLACLAFVSLTACGASSPKPAPGPSDEEPQPSPGAACVTGGCSGTMCVEEGDDAISTCEWRDEYACYQSATCERQDDGACGWTETEELSACLESPPSSG